MNKTVAIGAVILLSLTGCTSSGPDPAKVDAYHKAMSTLSAYQGASPADLDKAAQDVCDVFRHSEKTGWSASVLMEEKSTDDVLQANALVVSAVAAFCPQYKRDVPRDYLPQ